MIEQTKTDITTEQTKLIELRNNKLAQAIIFVNNHLPQHGELPYTRSEASYDQQESKMMEAVPGQLANLLNETLESTLRFINRSFKETNDF